MTQSSRPFTGTTIGDAGPYSASQWWSIYKNMAGIAGPDNGPLIGSGTAPETGLSVQETSPQSAGVRVFAGAALVDGTYYETDATVTLAIAANTSGNPRIDTVVLRKDTSLQTVRLAILQGSPAATPVAAGLTQTASTYEIPLADIAVANGFTVITNANITPRRSFANAGDGIYLSDILNNTAGILECGQVVVWDTAATRAAKTTTTIMDTNTMGVWLARTAAGGYGRVIRRGIGYVKATAAANRGDLLITSATAGSADVITTGTNQTSQKRVLGVALETTTGAGLVLALIDVGWDRQPAHQAIVRDNGANYTTTSTAFVNVDATNLSITLIVSRPVVLVTFTGLTEFSSSIAPGPQPAFDITVDGTRYANAGSDGFGNELQTGANSTNRHIVSIQALFTGLSAGSHTFRLVYKAQNAAAAVTLYSGAGVAGTDTLPTLTAVEL